MLGAAELTRRAALAETAVQAASAGAGGAVTESLLHWVGAYHALTRATLQVRARLIKQPRASRAQLDDQAALRLAEEASRIAGVELDVVFVRAVAAPPQGRIGIVIMRRLAALFDERPETIAGALFPVRRPSPYAF